MIENTEAPEKSWLETQMAIAAREVQSWPVEKRDAFRDAARRLCPALTHGKSVV